MGQSITRNKLAGICCRAPSTASSAWIKEPCPPSSRGACKRCRASWQLWDVVRGCSFGIMKLLYLIRACCALAGGRAHCSTAGDTSAQVRQPWYCEQPGQPGQCPAEPQPCSSSHTAPLAWHCALANTPTPSAGPISQGRHSHAASSPARCALQTLRPLCHTEYGPTLAPYTWSLSVSLDPTFPEHWLPLFLLSSLYQAVLQGQGAVPAPLAVPQWKFPILKSPSCQT